MSDPVEDIADVGAAGMWNMYVCGLSKSKMTHTYIEEKHIFEFTLLPIVWGLQTQLLGFKKRLSPYRWQPKKHVFFYPSLKATVEIKILQFR